MSSTPSGSTTSRVSVVLDALERALDRARPATEGGAWYRVDADRARREAAITPHGPGPLTGEILGVKDVIAVAGLPCTAGSRAFDPAPAADDAAVVGQARGAGAVILGTTATHELALGVTGINEWFGTPENPLVADAIPGGSSAGSAAAVAGGSCTIAFGTDTGGSVRIPAALCGVVGFKPAYDTYSTRGVLPLAPSLDHVGTMAGDVHAIRRLHAVLRGPEPSRPAVTVGVDEEHLATCSPSVAAALDAALSTLGDAGLRIRAVELPRLSETFDVSTTILLAEAAELYGDRTHAVGRAVADRLRAGAAVSTTELAAARRAQRDVKERMRRVFEHVDVIVGATTSVTAPPLADAAANPELGAALVAATRLANLCGHPALTLPLSGPVPVGLQIQGSRNGLVLKAARDVERILRGGSEE